MTGIDAECLAEDLIKQQVSSFIEIQNLSGCTHILRSTQPEKLNTKDSAKLHGTLLSLAALAESIEHLEEAKREELRSQVRTARFHFTPYYSLMSIALQVFSATIRLLDTPPSARLLKTSHLVLFAALLSLAHSAPSRSSVNPLSNESRWIEILHHAGDQSDEKVHAQSGEAIRRISESTNSSSQIDR